MAKNTKKEMIQAKMDVFVLRQREHYNTSQLIGLAMLHFDLYYDDAEKYILQSMKNINGKN